MRKTTLVVAEKKDRETKMRVHMDIDRRLWLRFKGRVGERGETLVGRIQELIRLDLKSQMPDRD